MTKAVTESMTIDLLEEMFQYSSFAGARFPSTYDLIKMIELSYELYGRLPTMLKIKELDDVVDRVLRPEDYIED